MGTSGKGWRHIYGYCSWLLSEGWEVGNSALWRFELAKRDGLIGRPLSA